MATQVTGDELDDCTSAHKLIEQPEVTEAKEEQTEESKTPYEIPNNNENLLLPDTNISVSDYTNIVSKQVRFTEMLRKAVDMNKLFKINNKDLDLLFLDKEHKIPDPEIYDPATKKLKAGFVLRSAKDIFASETNDA